jgi:hypothetical protein
LVLDFAFLATDLPEELLTFLLQRGLGVLKLSVF